LNKGFILGVFLGMTQNIACVSNSLRLIERALSIVLLIGKHLLRHLIHLLLLSNRFKLGLLFLYQLKDVPLYFHLF